MTVDEANTALAIASNKEERIAALHEYIAAGQRELQHLQNDKSEGYALISRLIDTRNVLTMAAQYISENVIEGDRLLGHRAIDELDQAMVHITMAIEAL